MEIIAAYKMFLFRKCPYSVLKVVVARSTTLKLNTLWTFRETRNEDLSPCLLRAYNELFIRNEIFPIELPRVNKLKHGAELCQLWVWCVRMTRITKSSKLALKLQKIRPGCFQQKQMRWMKDKKRVRLKPDAGLLIYSLQ